MKEDKAKEDKVKEDKVKEDKAKEDKAKEDKVDNSVAGKVFRNNNFHDGSYCNNIYLVAVCLDNAYCVNYLA